MTWRRRRITIRADGATGAALSLALTLALAAGPAAADGPLPPEAAPLLALPLDAAAAEGLDPDGTAPVGEALTCLARTVYWEAKGEGETAMRAVAHVVRNRVESDAHPTRLCAVVKEGGERRPCQFSWWCDGRPDTVRERAEYALAREVARQVLNGESADPTGGAMMFHNLSVQPAWARRAVRTATIGNHVFYRLPR